MMNKLRKFGSLILALLLFCCGLPKYSVQAESPLSLRVAFSELQGFFEYDENGNESGYGVELLNRISQYSGFTFTYVPCDSWEETKGMLLDGRADIRMPASAPSSPSATLSYSRNAVLSTSHVLMTSKSHTDLYYEDYANFPTLKVGMVQSMYDYLLTLVDFSKANLSTDSFVMYETYPEVRDALRAGDVDAIISNSLDMDLDLKILYSFDTTPTYISMTKDNPILEQLDAAMDSVLVYEPNILSQLSGDWFPSQSEIPLTREESSYLSSLGSLTFEVSQDAGYDSLLNAEGNYIGLFPSIAEKLCSDLGLECQFVPQGSSLDANSILIDPNFTYGCKEGREGTVSLTQTYLSESYYEITSQAIGEGEVKVAVLDGCDLENYIETRFSNAVLISYPTVKACIDAVRNGEADVTYATNNSAEYYLAMYSNASLRFTLISVKRQISMAVYGENVEPLMAILNKQLPSLNERVTGRLAAESRNYRPKENSLETWVIAHPMESLSFAILIGALVIGTLLSVYFTQKTQKQNQQLLKATNAKSDFLARMSHDIRTPLNVIIGMNHLAQENQNPPNTTECLEKIEVSSDFLLGLVNDVLDMERIESGKTEIHPVPYTAEEFDRYIDAVIRPMCEQKDIDFQFTTTRDQDFVVLQDKLRINQIYFNILSNAVKFTPEGGTISFHTDVKHPDPKHVCMNVTISDNGIGMSEEFQAHMFDVFSQENQNMTSVSVGSGMGLAIVKRLCDLMHMKIRVKSQLGKGTTFYIEGLYEVAEEAPRVEEVNEVTCKDRSLLKNRQILVCEDHVMNQEIIRRVLEKEGMLVVMCDDGAKGVEAFQKSSPGEYSAILMDIRMPIMDGLEACRKIRAFSRPDAKQIPIIAMTANAYEEDIQKSFDAGMDAHLSKPMDIDLLYDTLLKVIYSKPEKRIGRDMHA